MLAREAAYPEGEVIVDAAGGVVHCEHKKAAIIGAGLDRVDAPWADPTWCVWALNEIWQMRYHRHFELHPMAVQSVRELRWLERCPVPCYVLDLADSQRLDVPDDRPDPVGNPERDYRRFAGVANAVEYPKARVLAATNGREYFTNSFAYQLALALADGFEEIGLWGVGLYEGSARERTAELACLEYWMGVADGRGVKLTVGPRWLGRRPYLYGYHYMDELRWTKNELLRLRKIIPPENETDGTTETLV